MQIDEALRWAAGQVSQSDSAALDARVLLCHVLEQSLSYLYTWPDKALNDDQLARFTHMVSQRASGMPVAYITGSRDFWSLTLHVSEATLIPRPDTEVLVEQALSLLPSHRCEICDLGTGTGAIALALASERCNDTVTGVDLKEAAVMLATHNAARLNIHNARFIQSSWFAALTGQQFDMIVSNPPYVEANSPYLSQGDVRFEPASALTSGEDGLNDIRIIVAAAPDYLTSSGWLLIEHGSTQHVAVQQIFTDQGFTQVSTVSDLAGLPRVTLGRRNQ